MTKAVFKHAGFIHSATYILELKKTKKYLLKGDVMHIRGIIVTIILIPLIKIWEIVLNL